MALFDMSGLGRRSCVGISGIKHERGWQASKYVAYSGCDRPVLDTLFCLNVDEPTFYRVHCLLLLQVAYTGVLDHPRYLKIAS